MLDIEIKMNAFGEPVDFVNTQHDSAEYNSPTSEMKNLILQQGGVLTPATIGDYLNDDPYSVNKAVIVGGGWIMPTDSIDADSAVFTPAAAGVNNFPEISQYTNRLLKFRTHTALNNAGYTIDYDGDVGDLLDMEGNALAAGDLPIDCIVEIFYDGANDWTLRRPVKIDLMQNLVLDSHVLVADPNNVGGPSELLIGAFPDRGTYPAIAMAPSNTDRYYHQTEPPSNWVSKQLRFRVTYIAQVNIVLPAEVGWGMSVRRLIKNTAPDTAWLKRIVEGVIPDTIEDRWRKTDWSNLITVTNFDPGVDSLDIMVTREVPVANQYPEIVQFVQMEIEFLH